MKNIIETREWITTDKAAAYLTKKTDQAVDVADIYYFAHKGALEMSALLTKSVRALDLSSNKMLNITELCNIVNNDAAKAVFFNRECELTGGEPLPWHKEVGIVLEKNGVNYELRRHRLDDDISFLLDQTEDQLTEYDNPRNNYKVGLPEGCKIVICNAAIDKFIEFMTTGKETRKKAGDFVKSYKDKGMPNEKIARLVDSEFTGEKRLSDAELGALLPAKPGRLITRDGSRKQGFRLRKKYLKIEQ